MAARLARATRWAVGLAATTGAAAICEVSLDERERRIPGLHKWLKEKGSSLEAVEVKPCRQSPEAGLGLHSIGGPGGWVRWLQFWRWGREEVLAEFPLKNAITARTVASDPEVGELYSKWLDLGILTERQVVVMFLLTERAKGESSPFSPWIQCLPPGHDIPLSFPERAMEELAGTSLAKAAEAQRSQLNNEWRSMAPLAADALNQGGAGALQLSWQDFQWAQATYWSRALAIPEPTSGKDVEALLPGLDFANHDVAHRNRSASKARWRVSADGEKVQLVGRPPSKGDEVRISYGEKSNEELMFLYGFAIRDNPDDTLMVAPPVPTDDKEWDSRQRNAMTLLRESDADPRTFLTKKSAPSRDKAKEELERHLPKLQAFVMDEAELSQARKHAPESVSGRLEEPSRRYATLSLLAGLLESQLREMEQATGPASQDISLLDRGDLDRRRSNCVTYRLGQKEIARSYLTAARELLREEEAKQKPSSQ